MKIELQSKTVRQLYDISLLSIGIVLITLLLSELIAPKETCSYRTLDGICMRSPVSWAYQWGIFFISMLIGFGIYSYRNKPADIGLLWGLFFLFLVSVVLMFVVVILHPMISFIVFDFISI